MAYVGRQVEVAREGDVAVGRVVDHVVDPRTGFVAERERVAVQVPTEDGGTAVVMGERIRAVRVPTWIQSNLHAQQQSIPAIRGRSYQQIQEDEDNNPILALFKFCCFLCFLPCVYHNLCLAFLQVCNLIAIILLVVFTSIGPIHCSNNVLVDGSISSFVLLTIILLMAGVCLCVAFFKGDDQEVIRTCCFYIACILGIAFLIMVAVVSGFALNNDAINAYKNDTTCKYSETIIATVGFSYGLVVFFCYCWIFCFCLISNQTTQD